MRSIAASKDSGPPFVGIAAWLDKTAVAKKVKQPAILMAKANWLLILSSPPRQNTAMREPTFRRSLWPSRQRALASDRLFGSKIHQSLVSLHELLASTLSSYIRHSAVGGPRYRGRTSLSGIKTSGFTPRYA